MGYEIKTIGEVWGELKQVNQEEEGRIPTYFGTFEHEGKTYDFDKDVLQGGLYRGVIIMSGFPGQGKTSSSVQMALAQAEKGYKVLYLSLEQGSLEIVEKQLGIMSGHTFKHWEDVKFLKNKEEFDKRKAEGKELIDTYIGENLHLLYGSVKPDQMVKLVEDLKEKYDIIYCDNFQNIECKPGNETEELRYVSNKVKDIINEYKKCAFVFLSQLTDKYSSNPLKATINYSSKLGHDAVLRMVIYDKRTEEKNKKQEKAEEDDGIDVNQTFIGVLKNRKSQTDLREIQKAIFTFNEKTSRMGSFNLKPLDAKKQENLANMTEEEYLNSFTGIKRPFYTYDHMDIGELNRAECRLLGFNLDKAFDVVTDEVRLSMIEKHMELFEDKKAAFDYVAEVKAKHIAEESIVENESDEDLDWELWGTYDGE